MSASPTLAVVAGAGAEAGLREFLRIAVGVVAGGGALTLIEVGAGRGVLSAPGERSEDLERHLEALAAFDAVPRPLAASELRDLLHVSDRLVRVAAADRAGAPELVVVDATWLAGVDDDGLVAAFEQAGQVILA